MKNFEQPKSKSTLLKLILAAGLVSTLAACSDDDDDHPDSVGVEIRVSHASADSPKVNVLLDGNNAAPGLDYAMSTGNVPLTEGSYEIAVEAITPSGNVTAIGPAEFSFADGKRYDVVAVNSFSAIEPVIVEADVNFDQSQARVTVLHAAAAAPEVDVHLTAPNDTLSSDTVLASFVFKGTIGPALIPAGDYRIRVTAKDSLTPLYDSGTLAVAAGNDLFISAISNTQALANAQGKSPIALLVTSDSATSTVYSADDGADIQVVHASADAPGVDIIANDNFNAPLLTNRTFPSASGYLNVDAGDYNIKVAATGTMTDVIDADLSFANGSVTTVIALNNLSMIEPLVLAENPRSLASAAQVRIVHGSVFANTASPDGVDIYVTATADISNASPAVPSFMFKQDTGYVELAAGTYQVSLTIAGTKTVAFGPVPLTLSNGDNQLIIARDEDNTFGAVNLILP